MNNHHEHRSDVTTVEIVGGPEPLRVGLSEPDARWAERFREHRDRIATALGSTALRVEHIGSTSVPGLAAKPIVDVAVEVPDVADEDAYLPALLDAGYELRVREPGHRLVRTPERDAHVHVYGSGAPEVAAYLLLRDHLRTDDADRALYEDTKRSLMRREWADMNAYSDAKTEVIEAIKQRARAGRAARTVRVRPVEASDAEAWGALYAGYRSFYRLPEDPEAVARTWQWVLGREHGLLGLVAAQAGSVEHGGDAIVGLATLRRFARPSSASTGLYLDDLFTAPTARHRGVATALLSEAAALAADEGATVVRWITAQDNATARAVYDRFATATSWVTYDMAPATR